MSALKTLPDYVRHLESLGFTVTHTQLKDSNGHSIEVGKEPVSISHSLNARKGKFEFWFFFVTFGYNVFTAEVTCDELEVDDLPESQYKKLGTILKGNWDVTFEEMCEALQTLMLKKAKTTNV
jgi:hypothetical protein